MKKITKLLLPILLLSILLMGCSNEEDTISGNEQVTWKFAHEEVEGGVQDAYAKKFKEVIEEKSNGRIQIEIYQLGQLGDGANQVELLQNGAIELSIACTGATATLIPEANIFSLHYLFPGNDDILNRVLNESKAITEMINEKYYNNNIKILDWFHEGYNVWTSDRPITKPEDFKGFKIRTMASPIIASGYKAYGADPVAVPYMEVYSALQLKMVDGQINPITCVEEMKFYEVQDNMILSYPDALFEAVCVNRDLWESLPDDLKNILIDTVKEVDPYVDQVTKELNVERLEKIKSESDIEVIELTEEQQEEFRKMSIPVREEFVEMVGENSKQILDQLIKDIEEISAN